MEDTNLSRGDFKKTRVESALRRKKMVRVFWIVFSALAVIGGIYVIARMNVREMAEAPGEAYEEIGNEHIGLKDSPPKPYNSNPPTSGGHYGQQANWGIYDYEVNDRFFIHNLEHGGIWIAYKPDVPAGVVDELKKIVDEFGASKLVMAPRPANDADIAVSAWTHVYKFDLTGGELSAEEKENVRAFYRAFKNRGPEFVPDTMPGADPKSIQ